MYLTPYTVNTGLTTCPDRIYPTNGMIGYNMGTVSLRPVNTVATYTCDTGYTLNGGTSTRICESDGMWSGLAPICQRKWNSSRTVYLLNDVHYSRNLF